HCALRGRDVEVGALPNGLGEPDARRAEMVRPPPAVAAALALAAGPAAARSLNAAPNPSFEAGAAAPDGWTLSGARAGPAARTGARSLEAATFHASRVAASDVGRVRPRWSYRLAARLRCDPGPPPVGLGLPAR